MSLVKTAEPSKESHHCYLEGCAKYVLGIVPIDTFMSNLVHLRYCTDVSCSEGIEADTKSFHFLLQQCEGG